MSSYKERASVINGYGTFLRQHLVGTYQGKSIENKCTVLAGLWKISAQCSAC